MDILFDKNSSGSPELKSILGFLDVNIKFENIKSDILSASRQIIELVGKEVYKEATDAYKSNEISEKQKEFIYYMRLPIAINAYRMFAPNQDIAHTANGRKMRTNDTEKMAFEWMIDRDNNALEKKYYRALDDLICYLDENSDSWKKSKEYKTSKTNLFRTTASFDYFFNISSRLILMKLTPGVVQCLNFEIKPRLTAELFDSFTKDESKTEDELLFFYVKSACAYYSLAWLIPRFSVQIFPEGIIQSYISEQGSSQVNQIPKGNEVAYVVQMFQNDFKRSLLQIETIINERMQKSKPIAQTIDLQIISGKNFIDM